MRNACNLLFALLLLLPVACGGGGGGTPMVKITDQNALEVARQISGAVGFVGDFQEILSVFGTVIEEGSGSGTFPCPGGGEVSFVVNDLPPANENSAGDSVRITLTDCTLEPGGDMALDGRLDFAVTASIDVPPSGYSDTLRFTFSNLRLIETDGTITVNGGLTVQETTADLVFYEWVVSGSSLRATIQEPGGTFSASITNFRQYGTYDYDDDSYIRTVRGRLYYSDLGGSIDYETTTDFSGIDPNPPDQGALLVKGTGGTSMLFVVVDDENVRLEVDGDGDGIRETIIDTTWAELD